MTPSSLSFFSFQPSSQELRDDMSLHRYTVWRVKKLLNEEDLKIYNLRNRIKDHFEELSTTRKKLKQLENTACDDFVLIIKIIQLEAKILSDFVQLEHNEQGHCIFECALKNTAPDVIKTMMRISQLKSKVTLSSKL